MKKSKILVLIPALGLFLTGCSVKDTLKSAKSWVSQNIYHPLKDLIEGKSGKEEEKDEQKPAEGGEGKEGGEGETVTVTSVTVSPAVLNLTTQSADTQLTATVAPSNAANKNVTWSVVQEGEVVTVSSTGLVHVVGVGTATVKATSAENAEKVGSCTVTVTEYVPGENNIKTAYDAALVLPNNTESTEEYTFDGVVVGINGNSFYVQKDGYGMYVYNKATEGIALGKVVTVTATVKQYNGLPETATVSSSAVTGEGTLPTAGVVSNMETLGALKINVLASVAEASYVSKNKEWNSSNTGVRFVFSIGGDNVTVNFDKYGYDEAKATLLNGAAVGQKFALGNVLTNVYVNNDTTTPQLSFVGSSSVEAIATPPTSVTVTCADEVGVGASIPLTATVGPVGASQNVTWTVEDVTGHATVADSQLTGVTAGTVKVIATAAGTEVHGEKVVTVSSSVLPTEQSVYTLQTITGGSNGYATDSDLTINGIGWLVTGNTTVDPWRIGGKNLTAADRLIKSKVAVTSDDVSKVEVKMGPTYSTSGNTITVNSVKLLVGSTAGGSDIAELSQSYAEATLTFTRPEGQSWANRFFTISINITTTGTSNVNVNFKGATFYAYK